LSARSIIGATENLISASSSNGMPPEAAPYTACRHPQEFKSVYPVQRMNAELAPFSPDLTSAH
jgi:hypothetical protein